MGLVDDKLAVADCVWRGEWPHWHVAMLNVCTVTIFCVEVLSQAGHAQANQTLPSMDQLVNQ